MAPRHPWHGYGRHDLARAAAEPAKGVDSPLRSPFARDRARVLHSAALRRLAGKTQVVGPGEGAEVSGVPRTRLTHSLEVAQIGRGMAEELGCDPDIVDTAGLAHDIGHPPFGHNGEQALDGFGALCGLPHVRFEGNAQTLRILTRLEPKIDGVGLNLTRATLDAACKYPWVQRDGDRKYGAYPEDAAVFGWVRDGAPPLRACLEAQIMDWADDVAYSVHDVEDGILAGRIDLAQLGDAREQKVLVDMAATHFGGDAGALVEAAQSLLTLPVVADAAGFCTATASAQRHAELKRLTSELVGRFLLAAVWATRGVYGDQPVRRYEADLVIPAGAAAEVALLKAVALKYVMSDEGRHRMQAGQRALIMALARALLDGAPDTLDPMFAADWRAAPDEETRLRAVLDQVAILTDQQAEARHRALVRA